MKKIRFFLSIVLLAGCFSCSNQKLTKSGLDPQLFSSEKDGKPIALYTLTNKNGMEVSITNFGARIVSVMVPDKNGEFKDVVLGFDNIQDYINIPTDFGALVGRYANRIAGGLLPIAGDTIQLPQNNLTNCLHGGPDGWQQRVFDIEKVESDQLILKIISPDKDNQFPGEVTAFVTYRLTDDNAIDISYEATTTDTTVINLTNHSYFNLSGDPSKTILDHKLYINALYYTPIDSLFVTTGELAQVAKNPMDFTTPKAIGKEIDFTGFYQLAYGKGYDHCYVLDCFASEKILAASLESPESGIKMELFTRSLGVQLYTSNFLDGTITGKNGIAYNYRSGVCLETQCFPDTPNKPSWPTAQLNPGDTYKHRCIYKFSLAEF